MPRRGGAQRPESYLRGLRTRYEHGRMSKEALIAALRREADRLEERAQRALIPRHDERPRARALRREAECLERTAEHSSCTQG